MKLEVLLCNGGYHKPCPRFLLCDMCGKVKYRKALHNKDDGAFARVHQRHTVLKSGTFQSNPARRKRLSTNPVV